MRKRFRWSDDQKRLVPIEEWHDSSPDVGYTVIKDIEPYQSMIDGSLITSRSKHRQHLKDHGCVEVGNDSSLYKPKKPLQSPPGLTDSIRKAVEQQMRKR